MSDKFNYISIGFPGFFADDVGTVAMPRVRMFEFTPTDLQRRLEKLDDAAISFLEKLPTFLCSEVDVRDDLVYMNVRYGLVQEINAVPGSVGADFKTIIDLGELCFPSVKSILDIFDIQGFQPYRTHWAVREGDVGEIFLRLTPYMPESADIARVTETDNARPKALNPPPRDKKILGIAESVEGFLSLLYGAPAAKATETFFRGHSDATYELTPSLLRKWENGDEKHMPNEDRLCRELLIAHHEEFQGDQYCFDRLVRMQHYGLPTRLLDISGNPLIALFFACLRSQEAAEVEGEVVIFQVSTDKIKYYDSDTVSCISNLSNLSFEQKSEIDLNKDIAEFNKTEVGRKLLHYIRSEKGYFEGSIRPQDMSSIVCVKAKRTNSRIKSQSGAFLLFGHNAQLADRGQLGISIEFVTIRNKENILRQLDRININATTVYPSIDQTAIHLRNMYQLSALNRDNKNSKGDDINN